MEAKKQSRKARKSVGRKGKKISKLASPGKARAEGMRLFRLAGRPSKQDFIKVYGPKGPKMTWAERSEAGIPAAKFQAALAAKQ